MRESFSKVSFCFCALVLLAFASTVARADIVVRTGVNNQGTYPVIFATANDVLLATGSVRPGPFTLNFASVSGSQLLSSSGQGVTGGTGNSPLTDIRFYRADGGIFTRAVFNLDAATDGTVVIDVEGVNINGGFFEDDFAVTAEGQNFFTVDAINGQFIQSITLTAINGATFDELRQVRIGVPSA
jgi:hypothetical protein